MRLIKVALVGIALLCAMQAGWAMPVRILATGDMHGWFEVQAAGEQKLGGAAEMLSFWRQREGYSPEKFLVVACGDLSTGPAVSTAFKGDPVIEIMNLMGYDLSAVGNHEFDFGLDHLKAWGESAKFPFLAANLTDAEGRPSPLTGAYVLNDEQGVQVGVIGLTTEGVEQIANTGGLIGRSYAETLRAWVPRLRARGAQTIIVVAHAPIADLVALAKDVVDLEIPLMLGGHSHDVGQLKVGNTWVVNSGEWWKAYSRIDLDYNPQTRRTVVLTAKQVWLQQASPKPDRAVANVEARWRRMLDAEYSVPIGYTVTGLQRPVAIYNFIVDCWLVMDPQSDFAFSNFGSFRQDISAGPITKETILGVMPFSNSLVRLRLTGAQLLEYLPKDGSIGMAGLRMQAGQYLVAKTGQPIGPQTAYHVLVNDYVHNTSSILRAADPKPQLVYGDWREPVNLWLAAHPSSPEHPLEAAVDLKPRVVP